MGTIGEDFVFIHKEQVAVSSWLLLYAYVEQTSTGRRGLLIDYSGSPKGSGRSGPASCFYPGTTEDQFHSLDAAGSKGKWVHANIINNAYEVV